MNGEEPPRLSNFVKEWKWLILPLLGALSAGVLYAIAQSVGSPYWQGVDRFQSGDSFYRTVQIMNPGPWASRHPSLEFPISAHIKIISTSGGVSVSQDDNSLQIVPKVDLPPGISFLITYQYAPTNEIEPKLFCDGKECRNIRSSFDLDLILVLLKIALIVLVLAALFLAGLFVNERVAHQRTKESALHQAIHALVNRATSEDGERDAAKAEGTLQGLPEKIVNIKSKPVPRKKQNNTSKTDKKPPVLGAVQSSKEEV